MKEMDLRETLRALDGCCRILWVTPPGVLHRCENKGLAHRGICKRMKMRKIKIDVDGQAGKRDL